MFKDLMEKVNNIHKHMGNFTEIETRTEELHGNDRNLKTNQR